MYSVLIHGAYLEQVLLFRLAHYHFAPAKAGTDAMVKVKVSSYIARYPVCRTAQSALHFTPGRPVNSKAISTSLGSIQPRCNCCAKNIRLNIHHCLYCQVLIYTAERNVATWGDQTCQRFEATAVDFETGFSRLRVRPSNLYAIAPHNGKVSSYIARYPVCVTAQSDSHFIPR